MNENHWYNYRTGQYDYRETPTTDDDALIYLPQHPSAEALYRMNREEGKSVVESMKDVLQAVIGKR